jgi:hypothetical protein
LVFRLFSGRFQNFGADQKIFYLPGPNHLVGKGVWIPGSEVEPKRRTVDFHRPFFQAVDLAWASATFPSLPSGCRKVPRRQSSLTIRQLISLGFGRHAIV